MSLAAGRARQAARRTLLAYENYRDTFLTLTRRARVRFESRNWPGGQQDALNRLLLYGHDVELAVAALGTLLGPDLPPALGARVKRAYAGLIAGRPDLELAETFYNSAMRRACHVDGVAPAIEFSGEDLDEPPPGACELRHYQVTAGLEQTFSAMLQELPLQTPFQDASRDAALAAQAIRAEHPDRDYRSIELLAPLFFRNKGAYAVGRLLCDHESLPCPLVLALLSEFGGIRLDAVLLTSDEASIVFGFTRSYFRVDTDRPRPLVDYLRQIMPLKRIDELYTGLGFNRHGKAELYRLLMRHLRDGHARLEPAPGTPGTVMSVFTVSDLNVVFKVMRDHFVQPKLTDYDAVRRRYRLIFTSDRVGRLADAQEFEHLALPYASFSPEVLAELAAAATRTVHLRADLVHLDHLYTERRVTPLNVFLQQADDERARAAVVDYGTAIRDLAAANIFPGDLLLKNFGVTRHGRVIFYDYDEVDRLTDIRFRRIPQPRTPEEEMADAPWFHVGPCDVFPEELPHFLGLPPHLAHALRDAHADLFSIAFWQEMQQRLRAGEILDFFPYPAARRLHPAS